jgi:uracil phosphoribosyltransferase
VMQQSSYIEEVSPRLHIYPSHEADMLKQRLLNNRDRRALELIGRSLLEALDVASVVPVFVLRGGLILWQPYKEATAGIGPTGIVIPYRDQHEESPRIAYASLPSVPDVRYLLVDVLVASGRTMDACLSEICRRLPVNRVDIAAPFVSTYGRDRLLAKYPSSHIHCIWHAEQTDQRGWMIGPGFDIGDYTLGWLGEHVVWAEEGTTHS